MATGFWYDTLSLHALGDGPQHSSSSSSSAGNEAELSFKLWELLGDGLDGTGTVHPGGRSEISVMYEPVGRVAGVSIGKFSDIEAELSCKV